MKQYYVKKRIILLFILLNIILINTNKSFAEKIETNHVLILNSYSNENEWSNDVRQGVKHVLKGKEMIIRVEHMDTKLISDEKHINNLYQLYKHKFRKYRFDVIIANDNHAYEFLKKYHKDLFGNTPVICCGLNHFDDFITSGDHLFTGVAETIDVENTLDVALKIHPDTKNVIMVSSKSFTANVNRKIIKNSMNKYKDRVKFNFIQSNLIEEVVEYLDGIPENSIVLFAGKYKNSFGELISMEESKKSVVEAANVPIYTFWQTRLGNGIIGGKVISGYEQGQVVGKIADRILKGENIKDIPFIKKSNSKYVFDYESMKRYKIKDSDLPQESMIINKPDIFFRINKDYMYMGLVFIIWFFIAKKTELDNLEREIEIRERLLEEADKYDKMRTQLFATISHELKTPLNIILGVTQLLDEIYDHTPHNDYNKLHKYMKVSKQNCYRLLKLINNLIDITKIDAGYMDMNFKKYNIISVIEEITLSVSEYVESKGIQLIFDTEIEERVMACDAEKLERVMLNLFSNAIKFTEKGGVINVNIRDQGEGILICVKDTGIGIPEDMKEKVFEIFRQVDSSLKRKVEGSGMGLYLVKSIVELHKGSITLESHIGKGSEFIIDLPYTQIEEEKSYDEIAATIQPNVEKISIEFSDIYG